MNTPGQSKAAKDFDRHVQTYSNQISDAISFSGLEHEFFIKVKCERLVELVERYVGPTRGLSALDLGCGIGAYHPHLASKFESLSGIDVSEQSIEYARLHNPSVDYLSYDGERLPYTDNSFSVVFAICVFHHVPPENWALLTKELHRVLDTGGLAIIFEHNPLNPATQYVVRSCPIDDDAVLLWRRRTKHLLHDVGLSVIEARTILSVPPLGKALRVLDKVLGHLPFGAQYYTAAIKR
jgi:SAM-dependent methyltransferase